MSHLGFYSCNFLFHNNSDHADTQ
jgi:hypothetical protein